MLSSVAVETEREGGVRGQWTTELSGSARMFPKSRVESVSSSISPITALKHAQINVPYHKKDDICKNEVDLLLLEINKINQTLIYFVYFCSSAPEI